MSKEIKRNEEKLESYTISGLWITMFGFIVLTFIKEVINNHYMIHLYVDSLIAIVAFYVVIHNLKKQYDLLNDKKPFIIQIVSFIFGLFVAIISAKSPFDITFLILVISMMTSKKMYMKELNIEKKH